MKSERFARQSFLGEAGQAVIERCVVGLVGLGGAGSHIVQQLAHVGFLNYVLYDADFASESNLNRTVILTEADVAAGKEKIEAARRRYPGSPQLRNHRGYRPPVAGPPRAAAPPATLSSAPWIPSLSGANLRRPADAT